MNVSRVRIELLGGFTLMENGIEITVPPSAQRVVALLAMHPEGLDRVRVINVLYPDSRPRAAAGNLRSALWRARKDLGCPLTVCKGQRLGLAPDVEIDFRYWLPFARRLSMSGPLESELPTDTMVGALSQDLLPYWPEDWLTIERQRWDQARLHSLEILAQLMIKAGKHPEAIDAGLAAVAIEPYRETAHRAVITAYLAEGNSASAVAQYRRYHLLLTRDLGIRPTPRMQALIRDISTA